MKTRLSKNKNNKPLAQHRKPVDSAYLMLVFLVVLTGLLTLFSASFADAYYEYGNPTYHVTRQAVFAVMGLVGMFVVSKIDYHKLHIINIPLATISLILLILTPQIGVTRNSATRWINILGVQFQPSEIVKTAVIISFASFACIYSHKIKTFTGGILPYFGAIGVIAILLKMQPHLSATIIIALTGFTILFVAGIRLWYFVPVGIIGGIGVITYIATAKYALSRIKVWIDPFIDPLNAGWQGAQSFIAIGSGGFWGLGLGKSRQKHMYLPEAQNDFIFSVICEELGFVGATIIIIMFAALIIRGFYIAVRAKDKFGTLLATGITAKIAIQTIVNMCVVSGLMPVTGAALPFFSSGGTSLVIQLLEIGILLNISRQMNSGSSG